MAAVRVRWGSAVVGQGNQEGERRGKGGRGVVERKEIVGRGSWEGGGRGDGQGEWRSPFGGALSGALFKRTS